MGQAGISLVEVVVALAVSSLMIGVLGTSFFMLSVTPAVQSDRLNALEDLRYAARWLTRDGQVAQSFTTGANPEYGSLSWTDYSGSVPVTRSVTYAYSGTYLMRHEYQLGVLGSSQVLARNVLAYDDARFQYIAPSFSQNASTGLWTLNGGVLTATLTSTTRFTGDPDDQAVSTTVVSQLRSQSERAVSSPGNTPTPAPLPGEVNYTCSSVSVIVGTTDSGGCPQLATDDTSYWILSSSTGGPTKWTTIEITSTVITNTSLSEIAITYIGRASNAGVLQEIYVYNPTDPTKTDGGYHPDIADQGYTYTKSNTDTGSTFPISSSDLSYIDSLATKVVRIKAVASHNANYNLSVDNVMFRVR